MWKRYLERDNSKIVGEWSLFFSIKFLWSNLDVLKFVLILSSFSQRENLSSVNCLWLCLKVDIFVFTDLFVGQLKSALKCTSCGYTSNTFDPYWDLSLPIKKVCLPRTNTVSSYARSSLSPGYFPSWINIYFVLCP